MKQSNIFIKTRKEAPADEVSKSAKLLIRAGYINKEMAGVYDILPFGVRVMNKIKNIIREEMNSVGGQEIEMTALQDPSLWKKTNRWDDEGMDNWFKTTLKNGNEVGLGITHEEPIVSLMKNHINSYRDLPVYVYQFQTKFRNEKRAKSGIMRGREFLMKDLYSFSISKEEHLKFYNKMKEAYQNIFNQVGIGDKTFFTFASGGSFAKYSHEFQTITDAGEDIIFFSKDKNIAINQEVMNPEVLSDLGVKQDELEELKTVEVGNIFSLAYKFSDPLELIVDDKNGERKPVFMGSYGIGIGRLMGTVAEIFADEKGLVWPEKIAPFKYHLLNLLPDSVVSDDLYQYLLDLNQEVLYDDRELGAGLKLKDADLIGIPYQIVVGKNFKENNKIEIINRRTGEKTETEINKFLKELK